MLKTYKYQNIVDEMIDLVIEGYSSKDAFILVLDKYYLKNKELFLMQHDLLQIFGRGAGKASIILEQKRKEGILNRKTKELENNSLFTGNGNSKKQESSPLFSSIYNKPLKFKEQVIIQYKDFCYKYNNRSRALNETIKYFKIDISNPSDSRLATILNVIKELED